MNGQIKMGYAHISLGEYGSKQEEVILHVDARYFDKITFKINCIGVDTGHILKEIDLYSLLNLTRPTKTKQSDEVSKPKETKNVTEKQLT
jgi:hypothetical protein